MHSHSELMVNCKPSPDPPPPDPPPPTARTTSMYPLQIGYEPAGLTVHPFPQNARGWVHIFRIGV